MHNEFERLGPSQTIKVDVLIVTRPTEILKRRSVTACFGRTFTTGSTSSPSRYLPYGSDMKAYRSWRPKKVG